MNGKKYALLLALPLLALSSCGGELTSSSDLSSSLPSTLPQDEEREHFEDPLLETNIQSLLKGFRLNGNITQRRYEGSYSGSGDPMLDSEPFQTNIYYTDIAFNSATENAFYKYTYGEESGVTIDREGPYTFFEDENGLTYQEGLNYKNEVVRDYSTVGGDNLTFGDNGFYNFFTILTEEDFTLNESVTAYTRYDLSVDKAGVISNNLLYSLNSGAFALPTSAYIRVDNGSFTSLSIELSPVASIDNITGQVTFVTNSILFNFSHIGEETIEHLSPNTVSEDTLPLEEAFAAFEAGNFIMDVENTYTFTDLVAKESEDIIEISTYGFTGEEIYVHHHGNTYTDFDPSTDYYLAAAGASDATLYPYGYNADSGEWELKSEGYILEDGTIIYAQGYSGVYTYADLLPVIAGVSGAFFTKEGEGAFISTENSSALNGCFLMQNQPFKIKGTENISSVRAHVNENGSLADIIISYSSLDYVMGEMRTGEVLLTFSQIGNTTLEGFIGA